jgi:hypothetical protein
MRNGAGSSHRLTVDDRRTGHRLAASFHAHLLTQCRMDALPRAVISPRAEVAPDRGPGREVMWQGSPLGSCTVQVEQRIDHFTQNCGSWTPPWLGGRDERFKDRQFLVCHIAPPKKVLEYQPASSNAVKLNIPRSLKPAQQTSLKFPEGPILRTHLH